MQPSTTGRVAAPTPATTRPRTTTFRLGDLVDDVRGGGGETTAHASPPIATGYDVIDHALEGGIRAHDLLLVGGLPGVGKTVAALQWARTMARSGHRVLYACYEHDPLVLLGRLLLMEAASPEAGLDSAERDAVRQALREHFFGGTVDEIQRLVEKDLLVAAVLAQVERYHDNLWLQRATGAYTDLDTLSATVEELGADDAVLFVDYLQKVAVHPEPAHEADKVRLVAEGLKDLALQHSIPVVAIVAAEQTGLDARRLRAYHLRGSSALAYEADVIVMLNDKTKAVSKVHLAYDTVSAASYEDWVVFSIEKNRSGQDAIDVEFRKDFPHYRFHPEGSWVSERLVDERFDTE